VVAHATIEPRHKLIAIKRFIDSLQQGELNTGWLSSVQNLPYRI